MGILGIENRTENWKRARSFAPFFGDRRACASLANRLLKPLGKPQNIQPDEIQLELFWKGVRDYLDQNNDKNLMQQQQALIEHYQYVMATIVANLIGEKRRLVSFIVGNNPEYLKNHGQVQFMQSQGWLKKENVLSWDVVKRCASDGA